CALEAGGGRGSNRPHFVAFDRLPGFAVSGSGSDWAVVAGLVQPAAFRHVALPIVCLVQRGVPAGTGHLSVGVRARADPPNSGRALGLGFWSVCAALHHLRVARLEQPYWGGPFACLAAVSP